jgi:protein SCO1
MDPNGTRDARGARPRLIFLLPLLAVAVATVFAVSTLRGHAGFHGTEWDPPEPAADFLLTDHHGQPTRLSDHRGKTVLLFFGFVHCPDVCPLTLTRLGTALETLGADTSRVRVLLVTVDPRRDSPEALADYVRHFGPHVVGLTGDSVALERVRRDYHAFAAAQPLEPRPEVDHSTHLGPGQADAHREHSGAVSRGAEPEVTYAHTTQVFGIDRAGRLRVLISPEFDQETIRADIRTLMRM